jgi:hypothetical protein
MQSGTSVHLDANAAIPGDIRADDPRHLGNMTKRMTSINGQASNDTKYDPKPPPRVDAKGNPIKENFMAELATLGVSDTKIKDEILYAIGGLAVIALVCIFLTLVDPSLRTPVSETRSGYLFLFIAFLICVSTVVIVTILRRQNEIITWYPQLR